MNEPEHPDSEQPVPRPPQFLDYRGPATYPDRPRMDGGQVAKGIAFWGASVGAAAGLGVATGSVEFGVATFLAVFVVGCSSIGGRVGWRGFVPGLMIGATLTCLVPMGLLVAWCWYWSG